MSPKISVWNWILWRALALHKTKAAAVVMIKVFESDNPLSPKILSSHFLLFPWPIIGLPPKLGCHHKKYKIYLGNKLFKVNPLSISTTYPCCWENHISGSLPGPHQPAAWPSPLNLMSYIQCDCKSLVIVYTMCII